MNKNAEDSLSLLEEVHVFYHKIATNPSKKYLFKFYNRNTRKRFEICSKLAIKSLERHIYKSLLQKGKTLSDRLIRQK